MLKFQTLETKLPLKKTSLSSFFEVEVLFQVMGTSTSSVGNAESAILMLSSTVMSLEFVPPMLNVKKKSYFLWTDALD